MNIFQRRASWASRGWRCRTACLRYGCRFGYAAGYLALLLFVAAPLRRLGAYTISDFAGARLAGEAIRRTSALVVLLIAGLYLVPQLKGAGITVSEVVPARRIGRGVIAVAGIVTFAVGLGGMRGVTYVQVFQFWVKACAISVPAIALLIYLGGLPQKPVLFGAELPRAPANGLSVTLPTREHVVFPEATNYHVSGQSYHARRREAVTLPAGTLVLPGRIAVPVQQDIRIQRGAQWSRPVSAKGDARPLVVYSLLLATFFGDDGFATYSGPVLHQRRWASRSSDHSSRARAPRLLLLVSGRLWSARPSACPRVVRDGRYGLRRIASPAGGLAGDGRQAPRSAGGRWSIRRVYLYVVRASRLDQRNAFTRCHRSAAATADAGIADGGFASPPRSEWRCPA